MFISWLALLPQNSDNNVSRRRSHVDIYLSLENGPFSYTSPYNSTYIKYILNLTDRTPLPSLLSPPFLMSSWRVILVTCHILASTSTQRPKDQEVADIGLHICSICFILFQKVQYRRFVEGEEMWDQLSRQWSALWARLIKITMRQLQWYSVVQIAFQWINQLLLDCHKVGGETQHRVHVKAARVLSLW